MASKLLTGSNSYFVLFLMILTAASEKVEESSQKTSLDSIEFLIDRTILDDRSLLPGDSATKGNVFERLDRLEAKVSFLLTNLPRNNKMAQNEAKDWLELELPQKPDYGPVNKKGNDYGEQRPERAARLLPLSLLIGKEEKESYNDPPTNCRDLNLIGYTLNGFFNVRNEQFGKMETIYCDFKHQQNQRNGAVKEKRIGFVNLQSTTLGVYFHVQRTSPLFDNGVKITFEVTKLNLGGAMDLKTGIFTAPFDGIYHFSVQGSKGFSLGQIEISLRLNDAKIPYTSSGLISYSFQLQVPLKLKAGDRVYLIKESGGTLVDDGKHILYFSGHLLKEELALMNSTVVKV